MSGIIEAPKKGLGGLRSFIDERVEVLPIVQIHLATQFLNSDELLPVAKVLQFLGACFGAAAA